MTDFSTWDMVRNLLMAARWTVLLSVFALVCGGVVGVAVLLMRSSRRRSLRTVAICYIEVFQGTPLLMQLFLLFFGLSLTGVEVSPWTAAGAALTLFTSAYLAEIWRGCVDAIPRGQWEAADSLSLSYRDRMRDVILPQAVRIAVAPTVGYMVQIIKGTSLAAIIGFTEITRAGQIINNATFQPLIVFSVVAAIYFVLCWPLSLVAAAIERRHRKALAR